VPQKLARRAAPVDGETTQGWNELAQAERVRTLEGAFEDAMMALESGDEHAAAQASDALTALRYELYATPEGRAHHEILETRLERFTEDEKG
jgi:hypothetical protein